MQQADISLSADLKKLEDEGFFIEVRGSYLLVHEIPYVNSEKQVKYGTIVTVLSFIRPGAIGGKPNNHTAHFIGDAPCDEDGNKLTSIINDRGTALVTSDFEARYYFSYKPMQGHYLDFYEKISAYAHLLSSYAKLINPDVTEKAGKREALLRGSDVFKYPDTNSARANIDYENLKFRNLKIGIIGVGGTGSYILDLVSKTRVKEIHIYDDDELQLHNTFRSPGTLTDEQILHLEGLKKVDYYDSVYSRMHLGIKVHPYRITTENIRELDDLDYVFLCVDEADVRYMIVNELVKMNMAFSDVGLGVIRRNGGLLGTIRVTSGNIENIEHLSEVIGKEEVDENEYNSNIQIAELNCLNAALAVIKWKRYVGFYMDLRKEHHSLYHIETNKIINDYFAS